MPRPRTPLLTVDVVIELEDRADRPVVFIERRNEPHGWALPGGFVDMGESVSSAARREAHEETGLIVTLVALLGCYSDPNRDPRGQTASIVYVGRATGVARALDDAVRVKVCDPANAPPLVFDHEQIVADYLVWRAGGGPQTPT